MTREEQISTIKQLRDLTADLEWQQDTLDELEWSSYDPPEKPVLKTYTKPPYPDPESSMRFNWRVFNYFWAISALIFLGICKLFDAPAFLLLHVATTIGYIMKYREMKKADVERVRNSDEFKAKLKKIDDDYDSLVCAAKEKYEQDMHEWKTVLMPRYEVNKAKYEEKRKNDIAKCKTAITHDKREIARIYGETKIIPTAYRTLPILEYIEEFMASSNFDVDRAIENYDRDQQRAIDEKRFQQEVYYNQLQDQMVDAQERANNIADRARRDANRADFVAAVQRHNTNKHLKKMADK